MGAKTEISWCDSTINPTSGCDGCELWNQNDRTCYAGTLHESRLAKSLPDKYAASFAEVRMIAGRMAQAANWPDLRGKERPEKPWLNGLPRLIFVGDMGDVLSRAVTDEYIINEIFGAMTSEKGQRHFYLFLTKRPRRLAALSHQMDGLPRNCMAMTTITNQRTADKRIPALMDVDCYWRGISAEPLRGDVDLYRAAGQTLSAGIGWLICGGASGQNAAPLPDEWARHQWEWCQDAAAAFFYKQTGGAGRDKGGCLMAGQQYKEMPPFV
jgi:protein gp37